MDLFFSSDALKRKNLKRKKEEVEDDDLLLRELERDVEVDSTRCEECGGTSFTEDESGTFFFLVSDRNSTHFAHQRSLE